MCGNLDSLDIVPEPYVETEIEVYNILRTDELSCYWHFNIDATTYEDGTELEINVINIYGIDVYIMQGEDRNSA